MPLIASNVSIFNIHLIFQTVTLYLTPQDLECCQLVSKTWRSSFYPFRRIHAQWRSTLTHTDQERLLSQCTNIWTLSIPLDDPTSHSFIQCNRLGNVRELTFLGRGRYKELYGPQWRQTGSSPDWNVVHSDFDYELPGAVEQLLKIAVKLASLKIEYEETTHLTSHQQFSKSMLHTLCQHQTLSTILLDFPHGLDWSGVQAALHSLPDMIESLEINGSSQWAILRTEQLLETVFRTEPYLRLRRIRFSKDFDQRQLLTGLLPFLQLCPHLQEFRLGLMRIRPWCEKLVADTLLEHCPDINNLDLRYWETAEQMRLVQGYAFKTLQVCDFILRDPASIEGEPPAGPSTIPRPMEYRPRTIPALALSGDTLEVLELESTHCWTPYHDLDLVLSQFPNLRELTMDQFDFQPQDQDSLSHTFGCMTTKIEKLTLVIHERPTYEQNQNAIDFCSMKSLPLPFFTPGEEEGGDYYDRRSEWYYRDLFGIFELDVAPTTRQSSVHLAGGILQLYDQLALLKHLQDLKVIWYIYRSADAVWDYDGNLDVRGPLQIELQKQGLNRAALQNLNLKWTNYPAHDEDKEQEVDAKLKARGFVLTDMEAAPRQNRVYGEHLRAQRRDRTMLVNSIAPERESFGDDNDDVKNAADARVLYKSRNTHRAQLEKVKKNKEKGRHVGNT